MLARQMLKYAVRSQSNLHRAFGLQHQQVMLGIRRISRHTSGGQIVDSWDTSSSKDQSNSIFNSNESGWDHVFKDLPTASAHLAVSPSAERKAKPNRPQHLTARESKAFSEMFDMVFQVMENQEELPGTSAAGKGASSGWIDNSFPLQHYSKKVKRTSEVDQELDRRREEMDLCYTDQQLLDWAMREVFGESQQFDEQARMSQQGAQQSIQLQLATYPHLIAALMCTFRDKYTDPHLALAIFDYARSLSVASYVFGCTTQAYNELLETRWRCFRDLRGVCQALEEMRVNGIDMNTRTRALAELTRREVGERNLWEEEISGDGGEVWAILARIERLSLPPRPRGQQPKRRGKKWTADAEAWKNED